VPLTVKDILEKTFKRSFKGYDEDEVDKFLDQIIDEFKELQNENAMMKNELATLREQARKVKEAEDTIMNTLVSAQKSAERIINDASRKAELVISSAESTARKRAEQATQELADAEVKLQELKGCAQSFATSFANMVNAQAAHFEKTFRSYFGKEEPSFGGGINTDALHRIDKDIAQSLKDMPGLNLPDEPEPTPEAEPPFVIPESVSLPSADTEPPAEGAEDSAGFMELYEINKMLGALESGEYPSAPAEKEQPAEAAIQPQQERTVQPPTEAPKAAPKSIGEYKPKYDDYSWIYENDDKPDDFSLSFKDPKEKEDLKTLIDEIID
jgi:cell division initiation protein